MEDSMHNSEHSRSQRGENSSTSKKFLKILLVIIPIFLSVIGTYVGYMGYQDNKTNIEEIDKISQDVQTFLDKYADQVLIAFNNQQMGAVAEFIDPNSEYFEQMKEAINNQAKNENKFKTIKIHPSSKLEKINATTYKLETDETYIFQNKHKETYRETVTKRMYTFKIEKNKIAIISFVPGKSDPKKLD
ncbi:hypothetical protein OA45_03673 [Bacillus sp. UMTAT18]|uniref:TcaA NTF2-like domain-containing protein n=1 Tax=Bacillus TaxID=1386 RepID=UPI0006187165|nr:MULTISPECIES: hypothetical protein [Bacillus]MDA1570318.1 hypothetical protein [Bacillus cereus]KKC54091.1 hypothetical protein OA45_03673 [Bacillus sp. UMTAT18]MDA1528757.1 hypothetical protein [Bacillus cereus group sp. TH260-2LC]MDU2391445.1 hypothetical protein [Bacillus sp. (in: firmicutes)]OJD70295.1 hypothetical protein BAU29_27720 [Bacillus sp. P14-1]